MSILGDIIQDPINVEIFNISKWLSGDHDTSGSAFVIVANNIVELLADAAGAIFLLMFVIGGLMYITSNGNPQRAESGKKYLTYAVIGLIMVLLARVVTTLIRNIARDVALETTVQDSIMVITNFLLAFVGGLAVLFIIIGGIRYIVSMGNSEQVTAAKKTLTYAVTGLVAVLLSWVVLTLISSSLRALF